MPETGHAATPGRRVFARHAASLLVVRETASGPQVLMGLRGKGHRFMPNRLVFPGGAVDPGDGTAPAATEPDPALLAALSRRNGPRLARGLVVCAARELQEETGLNLGTPPRLDGIAYLCRAVTPPAMAMRFNARFLVVSADHVSGTPADSEELSGVGYRDVTAVLSEGLARVTAEVLGRYMAWRQENGTPNHLVYRTMRWLRDDGL